MQMVKNYLNKHTSLINKLKKEMKKLVFLTGAGVSAESGLSTFRDSDGLWENYNVMDVASADGFRRNPELVHQFYNARRHQLVNAKPNDAHLIIKDLEKDFEVLVITQNVDDLHEKAGSKNVLHLHGELMKVRSISHPERVYTLEYPDIDTCAETVDEYGDIIRPHIVFFQEDVPMMDPATRIVEDADAIVVIGTSLAVYPAASLVYFAKPNIPIFYIDPKPTIIPNNDNINYIAKKATEGMAMLAEKLRKEFL